MPGHILLTPLKWFQEISHYPAINVEGRNLKVSCTAAAPDVLLSNNAKWTDLAVELGILIGEQPLDGDGNPLKQGIGCFYFSDVQAHPLLHGWFYLKPDSYAAVWDQVRDGGYVGCNITMKVGPVQNELPPKVWDVSQPLFILAVLRFTRKPIADKPADQAARPVAATRVASRRSWVSAFRKIEVAAKQKWHELKSETLWSAIADGRGARRDEPGREGAHTLNETLFRFTLGTGSSSLAPDAYAPSPGIELRPVPDEVAAPVPQTRGYRYVVASNRVLLVGTSRIVVGADANAR